MKRISLFMLCCLSLMACSDNAEQETQDNNLLSADIVNNPRTADGLSPEAQVAMPTMDFKDTVHNFGDIREGEVVSHKFMFTNNGENPLVISNAVGSCGCTAPDFPREPVPPGKNGVITVQFNSAGREGHQEKAVHITANTASGSHVLHIKGMVKK